MKAPRIGIVGAGPMGRLHARTVSARAGREGDCTLSAVMDRNPERAGLLAEEFGGRACAALDALADEVDAAIVCVTTAVHHRMAVALLEAGVDLLVEKPLAATVEEGEQLAELARARGRILQVGHVEWYNPGWREALRAAGTPHAIAVERLNPPSERGLDLDVVQDLMIHDLDWVSRWLGEPIVELEAEGRCVASDRLDEARARLRFRSGCRVELRASRVHPERRRRVHVEGSRGAGSADLLAAGTPLASSTPTEKSAPLERQWSAFLDALRRRTAPDSDAGVGVAALRLVDQVRAAIADGAARAQGSPTGDDDPALRR